MKIGYSDFTKLLRVEDPENWVDWLIVRKDGVYVKEPPLGLTAGERSELSQHSKGNLEVPVLSFPCDLTDLQKFLEEQDVYSCLDPFDMADWVLGKIQRDANDDSTPNSREHASDKLSKVNRAAFKFWSRAKHDDRETHPINAAVAAWLEEQGFPKTLADKAATIIRPEWAPTGRKPEK